MHSTNLLYTRAVDAIESTVFLSKSIAVCMCVNNIWERKNSLPSSESSLPGINYIHHSFTHHILFLYVSKRGGKKEMREKMSERVAYCNFIRSLHTFSHKNNEMKMYVHCTRSNSGSSNRRGFRKKAQKEKNSFTLQIISLCAYFLPFLSHNHNFTQTQA